LTFLILACFENYLSTKVFGLNPSKAAAEDSRFAQQGHFLHMYDQLSTRIKIDQRFELMKYLNYPLISFNRLFSSPQKFKLEFPKSDLNFKNSKRSKENIIDSIKMNMISTIKSKWPSHSSFILELLPFLSVILSPDLKPGNVQIANSPQFIQLVRIVEILSSFGFKLVMNKSLFYFILDMIMAGFCSKLIRKVSN
jgi:hypothetical protein